MNDFRYVVHGDHLSHAYYKYASTNRRLNASSKSSKSEVTNIASLRKQEMIAKRNNGVYKSPYYDPIARHERYMRERSSLGIKKLGVSSVAKSGSSRSRGGSGKASKGSSRASKRASVNISATIAKLREESSLNTDAQREATRRKIEDLRNELKKHVDSLSSQKEGSVNTAEIRGKVQELREQIELAGGDLQEWISKEREALEKRIKAVYEANGKKYTSVTQADKQNASKKRNKEVNSRADSIYKSKSSK